jgi:D-aminoacyl-tRNA deacylase
VFAEEIDKKIDGDFFIFATRHQSREEVHSLSCHTPGNWGKADFGGSDRELGISSAIMLKKAYLELKKYSSEVPDHEITLEVTHHGPLINKPCMFIEIGSTQKQWENKKAGEIIANVIISIINSPELNGQKIAFGIGGPHYCSNFNKILERTDIAIGHICPKYALSNLDEEMIKKAIFRTKEKVELVLLDWKGLGTEKQKIVDILKKLGIEYKRSDQII